MTRAVRPSARCRTLLRQLSRHLDGDLTPARRRAIDRHLEACACCGPMAARLKKTLAACRAAGRMRLPRDVRARAKARIAALLRP